MQSLLSFANLKQSEAGWKEQLKVDTKFAELDRVGFQSLVTRYGRLCIKVGLPMQISGDKLNNVHFNSYQMNVLTQKP